MPPGAARRPRAPRAAWLLAGALCAGTAGADVAERLEYSYYEVPVRRGLSLREELNAASPIRSDGRTFHAYTKWHVNWHYQYRDLADGRCAIGSVHTILSATMTLPEASDPAVAHDSAYIRYLAALKVHEQGHYDIGRRAAADIDAGILALPSQLHCATLGTRANELAEELLADARVAEAAYDRDTGYGRTQGAALR